MEKQAWMKKAMILGLVFFLSIFIIKPIGVSTQFSVLSGIIHSKIDKTVIYEDNESKNGYRSTNAYYDKSDGKLAKSIAEPWNYDFVYVLAIPLGAFIGYFINKHKRAKKVDHDSNDGIDDMLDKIEIPKERKINIKQYIPSLISGFLIMFGARLADGCTSGHMMSGIMQGSISGFIFMLSVFIVAVPVAILSHKGIRRLSV